MPGRPWRCTPCGASRPTRTASRPPAPSTSSRSCSGRSRRRGGCASSRPTPSP
jgi:hypothetical protein